MNIPRSIKAWAVTLACTLILGVHARAADFSVNPVRVEFTPNHSNTVVRVVNFGGEAVTVQAQVMTWTDRTEEMPTDDVLLNPPIFTIGPKQSQFVRIGLRRPNLDGAEHLYRLVLEEVPPPPQPGFTGLRTLLRLRLPVFVQPTKVSVSGLSWEATVGPDGRLRIIATNPGNVHVQVRGLELRADADTVVRIDQLNYVLPNEKFEWMVDDPRLRNRDQIQLTAATDTGLKNETLLLKYR